MKKVKNKQGKTSQKIKTKKQSAQVIIVKNAEGDADTKAQILVQNKINYTPKVSVIIPVYNVEAYLRQCLDSVIKQTLEEIEIICVDDGSTDNSLEILKEYAAKDKRITILKQQNLRACVARNAGLSVARGKYVHFLDSDDMVVNTIYQEMLYQLSTNDADMGVFSWSLLVNDSEQRHNEQYRTIKIQGFQSLNNTNKSLINVEVWNKLFKREYIAKYNIFFPNTVYGEDASFVAQYIFIANTIFGSNSPLYIYRVRPNSLMGNILNTSIDSYKAISYTLKFLYALPGKGLQENKYYLDKLNNSIKWLGANRQNEKEALAYLNDIYNCIGKKVHIKDTKKGSLLYLLCKKKFYQLLKILYPEMFTKSFGMTNLYDLRATKLQLGKHSLYKKKKIAPAKNCVKIVFLLDNKYFFCTYVALASLIHSKNKDTYYDISILHTGLSLKYQAILSRLNNTDIHITFIGFDPQKYLNIKNVYHVTNTACVKFDIPNIFCDLDKILYIDGDVLIKQDLTPLFNIDLGDNYIAAVREMQASLWNYHQIVGSEFYINSGVMLLNLKKMREDDIPAKMMALKACQPKEWKCMDQDVFNKICDKKILLLGLEMNCTISIFIKRKWDIGYINSFYGTNYKSYDDLYQQAFILHFAGDYKPWVYDLKQQNITKDYFEILKHSLLSYSAPTLKQLPRVVNNINKYKYELKKWYLSVKGCYLDIEHAKTFNEKIQWLKLYDSTPLKTRLADKYLVRDWIKEKIGEQYLIPLLGVYDKFEDIDFDKLPNQFVIKCNHGSGWNIIVKDKSKLDLKTTKQKLDLWMHTNFAFQAGYELHYKNIPPKIIIEEYIDPVFSNHEIQCWVFNKEIKFVSVETIKDTDNLERGTFYLDGTPTEFEISPGHYKRMDKITSKKAFDKAIKLARELMVDVPYVRIDFIEYADDVRFREMTFTSGSGLSVIKPEKYNLKLGDMIKLPELAYNIDTGEYYKLPKKSKIKPYLLFPYYLWKKARLQLQKKNLTIQKISAQLLNCRIDIRNIGNATNAVEIKTSGKVTKPSWLKDVHGQGQMFESSSSNMDFTIKTIGAGKLVLSFRGPDRRFQKSHFPLWIDYTSIKINGKEILNQPVLTWHAKPYLYEMPVKDGDILRVDVKQTPHKYIKEELKDTILKLNPDNSYIKDNCSEMIKMFASFLKLDKAKHFRLFSITQTGAKTIVNVLGLRLEFKNKQQEILQVLQQNQQSLLQAVNAAVRRNDKLEQQNAALSQQINAVNRELQQAKLWLKQTYETFPTLNKQLANAQETLLSQLVTERKVNRLAAIVSVEIKRQKKHHQEIRHLLSKFIADTQIDLRYLRNLDVAKTKQLHQAADKLARQMQSAAQMQEKQLAGMRELLVSGQATLQYLKGLDVAKTEHLQQAADKLAQQMQSATQMQEKQLAGVRELLVSGQAALQHLKGLNVVNPEQLQQTAERLVAQITGVSQEQARLLNAVSGSLRQQQQEASSQAGHITGLLSILQKTSQTAQEDIKQQLIALQDKSLQQYCELNFADLLHDSTKHSPWLKDRSFALYLGAANYSFIYTLFRILDKVSPQHILEMGLGQTTRLTSQYIAYKNPSATLDVCEHNQDWIDIYTPELPKSANIKVHHLDLEYFDYDGKPNDKYKNISGVCGGTKYNLIIVDGPVGGGKNFPRSNVVDLIPHNLAEDFIIIFDDAERPGEQNTINKTLETLTSHGIQYKFSHRQASKKQFIITSKSWAFISLL